MTVLRLFLLLILSLPALPTWAQVTLTAQKLDSMKNDAKKLTNFLQDTEKQLQNFKKERSQKEARAISGDLRRGLRQNLTSQTQTKPTNTEGSASESRVNEPMKLEVPSPNSETVGKKNTPANKANTPKTNEENTIPDPKKQEKPDDVHDLWAELNKKEVEVFNQKEINKEAELIALKQALELQMRANDLQDLRQANWILAGSTILFILLFSVGFLVRSNKIRKKSNEMLAREKQLTEQERDKSDALLLNILPLTIAQELKANGKAQPRQYKKASVMFTDFKGFTTVAEKMTPHELVGELDECFARIDEIITAHNLEKIKTIGDAYMCVGGIPEPNQSNPIDAVLAGLEVQRFMHNKREERLAQGKEYWFLRLGINTGELVAGVIGKKKFAYDVWGDTVNSASRMESSGEVGKVNISGNTYEHIKDFFVCTYRGRIEAKNKGAVDMYFVESILPELSENGAGLLPNQAFWKKVAERV